MKRLVCSLSLLLLLSPALIAQDITPDERKEAVKYLEKMRDDLRAATKGFSDAQWRFKPAPDRWSAAEIVEHIAATEAQLLTTIQEKVMVSPAPEDHEDVKATDRLIREKVPDRSQKFQAPEALRPNSRFGSPKQTLKQFSENRARTIRYLKNARNLRGHAMDSSLGRKFDGYQWLLFVGAHNERHLKQLLEVKASPGFPKK